MSRSSCIHDLIYHRTRRLITSPAELIKTQQQLMQAAASHSGTLNTGDLSAYAVTRRILREYGVRGLFRGITSTALRDIGYGTYFGAYEATVRYWPRTPAQQTSGATPWLATLVAGGLAGIAGWVVTFPFDVIKTMGRWQSDAFTLYLRKHAQILAPYLQRESGAHAQFIRYMMPPVR